MMIIVMLCYVGSIISSSGSGVNLRPFAASLIFGSTICRDSLMVLLLSYRKQIFSVDELVALCY